jgi:tricorn protease-like protein
VSAARDPVHVASEFPEGTITVYAFASYAGMLNGTQCESVWYRDGEETARSAFAWALGDSGETWIDFIQRDGGLLSGRYNWELHVQGELIAGGVFVVGVPGAATPPPEPTGTSTPVRGPRITFVSLRDGNNEIYLMNADGSGVTRLTNNPAIDYVPACSWDGTRIAFMSRRDGNNEIYIMNSNGTGGTRVTNDSADEWDPAWSPDGTRIAFVSNRAGNNEIYVMNSNGTGITRVTNSPASDRYPSWSPDGARIAFTSYRDGNDEIFVINSNGTGGTRLTNNPANDWYPSWCPG